MGYLDPVPEGSSRSCSRLKRCTDVPDSISDTIRKIKSILSDRSLFASKQSSAFYSSLIREYCALIAHVLKSVQWLDSVGRYDFDAVIERVRQQLDGVDVWVIRLLQSSCARKGVRVDFLDQSSS